MHQSDTAAASTAQILYPIFPIRSFRIATASICVAYPSYHAYDTAYKIMHMYTVLTRKIHKFDIFTQHQYAIIKYIILSFERF